jgi:CheY-like chemotaxis protein
MTPQYVLIVDDEASVRQLLRRILESAGHDVLEAETAEDAICRVEECPPAVAFCDIHMPGANGLWLADQIRATSPTTAMVLATGDAEVPANESFRSGIVAYLLKPLNHEDVLLAVSDGVRWSAEAQAKGLRPRGVRRLGPGTLGLIAD